MSDTGASSEVGGYSNSTTPSNRLSGPAAAETDSSPNVGMASTLVGGLTKAFGIYESGQYNKKVAEFNAEYARIQAKQVMQAAQMEQGKREMKERYIEGQTTSGYAAQGVVVGAGTTRAVMAGERAVAEADRMAIEVNARRAAYGYQVSAQDQDARGTVAAAEGTTGAVSTLLNTVSQEEIESDPSYSGSKRTRF